MAGEEKEAEEEESKEHPIHNPHFPNPSNKSLQIRPFSDFIKNDVVFPPIDHEGLPPSPPSQTLIPSPPPEYSGGGDVARRWVCQLRAKVVGVVSFWDYFCGGANRSFCCGAVSVLVLVWWVCRRRRLRRDRLVIVIKEKDEKIKQLLHQIAQMNQLLLSLHKGASSQGGATTN